MSEWKKVKEELPPCDGRYLVRNIGSNLHGELNYDGYGFLNSYGFYCEPDEWSEIPPPPSKCYGKVKKE